MDSRASNKGESFNKFIIATIFISVLTVLLLYIFDRINPNNTFEGYFNSFSGFIVYFLGYLIPTSLILFVVNFVMLVSYERFSEKAVYVKLTYYLIVIAVTSLVLYLLFRPDWLPYYLCSMIPPLIFAFILEKKFLLKEKAH